MTVQDSPRRRVALFFGSFNPLHVGHYEIMRYVLANGDADELRIVVTPKNPSGKANLADANVRLENARRAIRRRHLNVTVSDVEFHLPEPTYTIQTLEYLDQAEPDTQHILVIGADCLASLQRWYRYQDLIDNYEIWVYPRAGVDLESECARHNAASTLKRIIPLDGPLWDISSTRIRQAELSGVDVSAWKM